MDLPKVKAILFTGKTYSNGTHPVMIRVTQNRKRIYKAAGFSIPPDAWDIENSRVYEKKPIITKRQEGQLKSDKLLEIRKRYKGAVVLSNAKHINSSIDDLINEINGISQKLKVNEE